MIPKLNAEQIIYTLVIVLSVIALTLIAVSPPAFKDNNVVYKGF